MASVTCEVCETMNFVSLTTRNVKVCKYCASQLPEPERDDTKQLRQPQRQTDTY